MPGGGRTIEKTRGGNREKISKKRKESTARREVEG